MFAIAERNQFARQAGAPELCLRKFGHIQRTLTINGGIVVKFAYASEPYQWPCARRLLVNGTLDWRSTANPKVVYTSEQDDTYG